MDINEFLEKLRIEMDDINPDHIQAETVYRQVENWSSMHALVMIAFADEHFGVALNEQDFKNTTTVQEIYDILVAKKAAINA